MGTQYLSEGQIVVFGGRGGCWFLAVASLEPIASLNRGKVLAVLQHWQTAPVQWTFTAWQALLSVLMRQAWAGAECTWPVVRVWGKLGATI